MPSPFFVNALNVLERRGTISVTNGTSLLLTLFTAFHQFSLSIISILILTLSINDVFICLTDKKINNGGREEVSALRPRGRGPS
jgi:hypothetical protein